MKKLKTAGFSLLVTFSFLLVSCGNNQLLTSSAPKKTYNHKPRFINDIAFSPSGNNSEITTSIPSSHIKREEKRVALNDTIVCVKYAEAIGIAPKTISNSSLYSFIEEWYGVPYLYGGKDKSGIDCSAFVQQLYLSVFGTDLVRTAFEQFNFCKMVKNTEELEEGDLVFFYTISRSRKGRRVRKHISHVGIYLANNYFVHASSSCGVMISSLDENYWAHKFAGAGQIPKS